MAKLQAVLEEAIFNTIEDETLKTLYVQNTETKQYFLDVENAESLAFNLQTEVEKLKTHNQKLLGEKKDFQEKYKPFEALGKSADEIKDALESNRPEEIAKLITDKETEWKTKFDSFTDSLETEKQAKERYRNQSLQMALNVKLADIREKFNLNDTSDFVLRTFYRPEETEDGRVITKIYGGDGQPILKAGQPITDEQFLNGLKEEKLYLAMFNAPNNGGTGATNRQSGATGTPKKATAEQLAAMSPTEKREFYLNGGEKI